MSLNNLLQCVREEIDAFDDESLGNLAQQIIRELALRKRESHGTDERSFRDERGSPLTREEDFPGLWNGPLSQKNPFEEGEVQDWISMDEEDSTRQYRLERFYSPRRGSFLQERDRSHHRRGRSPGSLDDPLKPCRRRTVLSNHYNRMMQLRQLLDQNLDEIERNRLSQIDSPRRSHSR